MGGSIIGQIVDPFGFTKSSDQGGLGFLPDFVGVHGPDNSAAKKAKKEAAARKHKLDNPEDDTQETTRVLQL